MQHLPRSTARLLLRCSSAAAPTKLLLSSCCGSAAAPAKQLPPGSPSCSSAAPASVNCSASAALQQRSSACQAAAAQLPQRQRSSACQSRSCRSALQAALASVNCSASAALQQRSSACQAAAAQLPQRQRSSACQSRSCRSALQAAAGCSTCLPTAAAQLLLHHPGSPCQAAAPWLSKPPSSAQHLMSTAAAQLPPSIPAAPAGQLPLARLTAHVGNPMPAFSPLPMLTSLLPPYAQHGPVHTYLQPPFPRRHACIKWSALSIRPAALRGPALPGHSRAPPAPWKTAKLSAAPRRPAQRRPLPLFGSQQL